MKAFTELAGDTFCGQNSLKKTQRTEKAKARANGWRYRQARELADKATRRRIRRLGPLPRKCGPRPHLSGARGVSPADLDGTRHQPENAR